MLFSFIGFFSLLILFFRISYTEPCSPAHSLRGTLPVIEENKIHPGFTLLSPLLSAANYNYMNEIKKGPFVYLLDLWGQTVHKWKTEKIAFVSMLSKDGHLWVALIDPPNKDRFWTYATSKIQEIDWDGNVIWEYKNQYTHHDFDLIDDGRVGMILRRPIPKSFVKSIKGGIPGSEYNGEMWSDSIVEIDRQKNITWEWNSFDHLKASEFPIEAGRDRSAWNHANSLRYIKSNPFDGTPAYLISFRNISRVFMIKRETGEILWKSPENLFYRQHDANLLDNGNILVFNNGQLFSNVLEINPRNNEIVWQYSGGNALAAKNQFFSIVQGGVQRLSNGNTLITASTSGHQFEITKEQKVVWDFISPIGNPGAKGPFRENVFFRGRRYGVNEINWPKSMPNPIPKWPNMCELILNGNRRSY